MPHIFFPQIMLLIAGLFLIFNNAEGFSSPSSSLQTHSNTKSSDVRRRHKSNNNDLLNVRSFQIIPEMPIRSNLALAASQDDQSGAEFKFAVDDNVKDNGADNDDAYGLGDYDFEAGFQARLKKEGGRTGVKVKAAKRSVNSFTKGVTNSVQSSAKQSRNSPTLVSTSEWYLTLGFLALVVLLAVGTHFSSIEPFETASNGEQLGFGIR